MESGQRHGGGRIIFWHFKEFTGFIRIASGDALAGGENGDAVDHALECFAGRGGLFIAIEFEDLPPCAEASEFHHYVQLLLHARPGIALDKRLNRGRGIRGDGQVDLVDQFACAVGRFRIIGFDGQLQRRKRFFPEFPDPECGQFAGSEIFIPKLPDQSLHIRSLRRFFHGGRQGVLRGEHPAGKQQAHGQVFHQVEVSRSGHENQTERECIRKLSLERKFPSHSFHHTAHAAHLLHHVFHFVR